MFHIYKISESFFSTILNRNFRVFSSSFNSRHTTYNFFFWNCLDNDNLGTSLFMNSRKKAIFRQQHYQQLLKPSPSTSNPSNQSSTFFLYVASFACSTRFVNEMVLSNLTELTEPRPTLPRPEGRALHFYGALRESTRDKAFGHIILRRLRFLGWLSRWYSKAGIRPSYGGRRASGAILLFYNRTPAFSS